MCDTPILSDHFALCTILKEEKNPIKLVKKKKIYDRNAYNKEKFLDDLKKANWFVIYQQNNANEMLKSFTEIFNRVLRKHAPLKNVFIRNNKSCFARSQTWLKEKNKELQKECDSSLKSKNFKTFSELKQKLFCSSNCDFNKFYQSLVMSPNNSRKRWNLMNEIRNSTRTRNHIYSLKNVFNNYVTEPKKIANLLNYRFSQLGKFILQDETCENIEYFAGRSAKPFSIRCITESECLQCIKKLKRNKSQGPSTLPPGS